MREYEIRKTQFTVTDFLSWQREGSLNLHPEFQRRSVWKPDAKSYFIDTVARGLPVPIIYLRQKVDLETQKSVREVVDGQQRLRTLFSFIDATSLKDYKPNRDHFNLRTIHNKEIAGKSFDTLSKHYKSRLLSYEFSVHILPIDVEDREVLEMFARLNATGVRLSKQELRNAEFFGEFKTVMYQLAVEQLDRWREWRIFNDDQISRMKEVEMTSDLAINMLYGLRGKTQTELNKTYKKYDQEFKEAKEVSRRFRHIMDLIDDILGTDILKTVYKSEVYFFSLFLLLYDQVFGLESPLDSNIKARRVKKGIREKLLEISNNFKEENVPSYVLDAVQRASSDHGRRKTRLEYMKSTCDG